MTRYSIHCWNCAYYDYADNHCKRFDREIPDYVLKADSNTMACIGFEALQVEEHVCNLCSHCKVPTSTDWFVPKEVREQKHKYCTHYHQDISENPYLNDHHNCPNWVRIK